MDIIHQKGEKKGRYVAMENDKELGEMTYVWAGEKKLIIDHTEVFPENEGKGIAKQLVLAGIEDARQNGYKILPLCPYAKSVFDPNKEYADVLF